MTSHSPLTTAMHHWLDDEGAAMFIKRSASELFEIFEDAAQHDAGVFGGAEASACGDL